MDPRARSTTLGGRTGKRPMTMKEIDELTERCWRNCQEKQKTDPSWGNLPVLGRFVPPSEIKAGLARLREETARLRAELEAEKTSANDAFTRYSSYARL